MGKRKPKPDQRLKPDQRFLVVKYDVSELSEAQLLLLAQEAVVQAEASDDHGGHPSVRVETKVIDVNLSVICGRCGSPDISYAIWHHPNNPVLDREGDVFGTWNYGDNSFCNDCEHDYLLDRGDDPDRFDALRAKYNRNQKKEG